MSRALCAANAVFRVRDSRGESTFAPVGAMVKRPDHEVNAKRIARRRDLLSRISGGERRHAQNKMQNQTKNNLK